MACFLPCIHDNCGSIGREKKGVDLGNDIEGMVIAIVAFSDNTWYFPLTIIIPTIILIFVNVFIFTRLASQRLTKEVLPLLLEGRTGKSKGIPSGCI
jgi:hypothetical protein